MASFLYEVGFWTIGLLLLLSMMGKLVNAASFTRNLVSEFRFNSLVASAITALLIFTEGILGILILSDNDWTVLALWCAEGLFLFFFAFVTALVLREKLVRCHCFGNNPEVLSWFDVVRNASLLFITSCLIIHSDSFTHYQRSFSFYEQFVLVCFALISLQVLLNLKPIAQLTRGPNKVAS